MTTVTLNPVTFRAMFPQFTNVTTFPDALIQINFDMGTAYVSPEVCGDMSLAARTQAVYLMAAHLMALNVVIAQNAYQGQAGITTGATVDGISVTLAAPPYGTSQWRFWLNQTPYGAQLVALLEMQAAGGFYIGGLPERAAFRRVGGGFGGVY